MDFLKKNWMQVLTLVLCAALLVTVSGQNAKIEELSSQTMNQMYSLESEVSGTMSDISGEVRRAMKEATDPVAENTLTPSGLNSTDHTLLMECSVTLRRWTADTAVTLAAQIGGETVEQPMTAAGNGVFNTPLTLPVDGGQRAVSLDVTVEEDGAFTRRELGEWGDISMLLPYQADSWDAPVWEKYQDGVLTLDPYSGFSICDWERYQSIQVNDPQFRVYRNGALVWEDAAYLDSALIQESYYNYRMVDIAYLADAAAEQPEPIEITCDPGDEILVAFACTDDSGLSYEFAHTRLTITEDGPEEMYLASDEFPTLTWPE